MMQQQRHFREIAFQWLQSIAHAFDSQQQHSSSSSSSSNCNNNTTNEKCCNAQELTDSANASLTQFEKTYVSFPEFISNDEPNSNWNLTHHHHHHHHHHHDTLQVAWPQSSRSTPSSMAC